MFSFLLEARRDFYRKYKLVTMLEEEICEKYRHYGNTAEGEEFLDKQIWDTFLSQIQEGRKQTMETREEARQYITTTDKRSRQHSTELVEVQEDRQVVTTSEMRAT